MSKYGSCAKDSTRHDTNYNSNSYNNFSMSKYAGQANSTKLELQLLHSSMIVCGKTVDRTMLTC